MNILVLGGGDSPEREVSLRSAKSVATAARAAGFQVSEADPAEGLEVLDRIHESTIVMPVLHGAGGEDGSIQAELEKRHLPFLGSDSRSSADSFDKAVTRRKLEAAGLPVAKGAVVGKGSYAGHSLSKKPHVLKVSRGGSSIGTLIVRDTASINKEDIDKLFALDDEAILEELVDGPEVTIPILDKQALPVIEIRPPQGLEFDYENKYNGMSAEICPPETISKDVQQKVQNMAEEVHRVMGCRHLSRVDIMIDKNSDLYVLEINTIPGLTDQSLYPKSASAAGLDMPGLVKRFVELVERDYSL